MGVLSLPAGVVRWLISLGVVKERVDLGQAEQGTEQSVQLSQRTKQQLMGGSMIAEAIAAVLDRAGVTPSPSLRSAISSSGNAKNPSVRWKVVAEALSEHLDVTLDETICQDLAAEKDESLAVELLLEVYTVLRAYQQQHSKRTDRGKSIERKREGYAAASRRRSRETSPVRTEEPRARVTSRSVSPAAVDETSTASVGSSKATAEQSTAQPPPPVGPTTARKRITPKDSPTVQASGTQKSPSGSPSGESDVALGGYTFLTSTEQSPIKKEETTSGLHESAFLKELDMEESTLPPLDPVLGVIVSTALTTLQLAKPGSLDEAAITRMVSNGEIYPFTSASLVKWFTAVLPHRITEVSLSTLCRVAVPALDTNMYGNEVNAAAAGLLYLAASRCPREDYLVNTLAREGYIESITTCIRNSDNEETRGSLSSAVFQIWQRDGASLVTLFSSHLGRTHSQFLPVAHSLVTSLSQHGEPFYALSPVVDFLLDQLVRRRHCCCAGCAALLGELWVSGLISAKANYTEQAEQALLALQERASQGSGDGRDHLPYVAASTLVSILEYVCRQEDEAMAPAVWRSLVYSLIVSLGTPELLPDYSDFITSLISEALRKLPCLPVCVLSEPICKLFLERNASADEMIPMKESEKDLLLSIVHHPRLTEAAAVEVLKVACKHMVSDPPEVDSVEWKIVKKLSTRYATSAAFASAAAERCLKEILPSLLQGPGSADAVVSIVSTMASAGSRGEDSHLRSVALGLITDLCAAYRSTYAALHPNLLRASRAFPELEDLQEDTPDPQTEASDLEQAALPGPCLGVGGPLDSFRSKAAARIRELEMQIGVMAEKHKEREDSLESAIRDLEAKVDKAAVGGQLQRGTETSPVSKLALPVSASARAAAPRKQESSGSRKSVPTRSPRVVGDPPTKEITRSTKSLTEDDGALKSARHKGAVLVLEGAAAEECSNLVKAFAKPMEVMYLQCCHQSVSRSSLKHPRHSSSRGHQDTSPAIALLNLLTFLRDAKIIPHITPRAVAEEFISSMEHPIRLPQAIELIAQCAFYGVDPLECRPWSQWGVLVPLPEHQEARQLQSMLQHLMNLATLPGGARGASDKMSMSSDEWAAAVRKLVRRYVRSAIESFDPSSRELSDEPMIPPGFALSPDGKSIYVADKSWNREGRTASRKQQQQTAESRQPVHTELLYNMASASSDASLDSSSGGQRLHSSGKTKGHSGKHRAGSVLSLAGGLAAPTKTLPEEADKFLLSHDRAQRVLGETWLNRATQTIHKHFLQTQSGDVDACAGLRLPAFTKCLTGFLKLLPDVSSAKLLFRRVAGAGSQEVDVGGLGRAVLASACVTPYGQAAIKEWPSALQLMDEHPDVLLDVGVQALYQRDFKDLAALRSRLHHFSAGSLPQQTPDQMRKDVAELQGVVVRSGAVPMSMPMDESEGGNDDSKTSIAEPTNPAVANTPKVEEATEGSQPAKEDVQTGPPPQTESQLVEGELADEAKVEGPVPASPEANNEDAAEVNSPDSLNEDQQGKGRGSGLPESVSVVEQSSAEVLGETAGESEEAQVSNAEGAEDNLAGDPSP